MRDARIADLAPGAARAAVRIAGRVTRLGAGAVPGRLRDESGSCPFRLTNACDLRRGDLVTLHGRLDDAGVFQAAAAVVRVRPVVDPFQDEEYSRLAAPGLRRNLRARADLTRAIRSWFDRAGFLEVETGQLVDEPGQEPTLDPFACGDRALITSPELRMKRLLAAGYERVYELTHCFRSGLGERSDLHHPEFTMLEWYRAFAGADELIADLEDLFGHCTLRVTGGTVLRRNGAQALLVPPFERLTVREAFARHAGVDLEPLLDGADAEFRAAARAAGFAARDDERVETLFFRVLLDRVEPHLGRERPTILSGYPAALAALARLDPDDPRVAERFECYVLGVELANAFVELTDPLEQRRRFQADRMAKRARGADPGPFPKRFLRALETGMPPAVGAALGVDRLLMLILGAAEIGAVLPFPESL